MDKPRDQIRENVDADRYFYTRTSYDEFPHRWDIPKFPNELTSENCVLKYFEIIAEII